MSNDNCKKFESCEAPLCPMDERSLKHGIWYPDEDICNLRIFRFYLHFGVTNGIIKMIIKVGGLIKKILPAVVRQRVVVDYWAIVTIRLAVSTAKAAIAIINGALSSKFFRTHHALPDLNGHYTGASASPPAFYIIPRYGKVNCCKIAIKYK